MLSQFASQKADRLEAENRALQETVKRLSNEEKKEEADVCRLKFRVWLCEVVKMKQYLSKFEDNECDDVRMIEFLEEDTLHNDIGVSNKLHRKLILKQVGYFKQLQAEFDAWLDGKQLRQYKQELEANGILTMVDLKMDFASKKALKVCPQFGPERSYLTKLGGE